MATISEFANYVKHFNRNNQFDFILDAPVEKLQLPSTPGGAYNTRRIFGKAISIPSIHGDIKPNFFFNKKYTAPTMIDVDNINITFYDTNTSFFHRFFTTWVLNRYDVNGALRVYPNDYSGTLKISVHNNHVYTLEGVFPIAVSDFRLDNESVDQFGTFDVTFFIKRMIPIKQGFNK